MVEIKPVKKQQHVTL